LHVFFSSLLLVVSTTFFAIHDKIETTTDMRTTQGHTGFGHNVQAIITFSNKAKPYPIPGAPKKQKKSQTFSNKCRWTQLFNARRTQIFPSLNTHNNEFSVNSS
jgi:hypothetical protein